MSEKEHTCRVVHDDILGHVCVMKFQFASVQTQQFVTERFYATNIHTHTHTNIHTHTNVLAHKFSLSLPPCRPPSFPLPLSLPIANLASTSVHTIHFLIFQRMPRDLLQMSIYVESVDEEQVYGTRELDFCTVFTEEVEFAA